MKAPDGRTPAPDAVAGSREPDLVRLSSLLEAYGPHDGVFDLRIPWS